MKLKIFWSNHNYPIGHPPNWQLTVNIIVRKRTHFALQRQRFKEINNHVTPRLGKFRVQSLRLYSMQSEILDIIYSRYSFIFYKLPYWKKFWTCLYSWDSDFSLIGFFMILGPKVFVQVLLCIWFDILTATYLTLI